MQNDNAKFKIEFKKRLYSWTLRLINFIDKLPQKPACNLIGNQLLRSGTSILANYIEASSASSKKDFTNFFTPSLKSANESKVWLVLLRDTNNGDKNDIDWLSKEVGEIANVIASSILTLRGKNNFCVLSCHFPF